MNQAVFSDFAFISWGGFFGVFLVVVLLLVLVGCFSEGVVLWVFGGRLMDFLLGFFFVILGFMFVCLFLRGL